MPFCPFYLVHESTSEKGGEKHEKPTVVSLNFMTVFATYTRAFLEKKTDIIFLSTVVEEFASICEKTVLCSDYALALKYLV